MQTQPSDKKGRAKHGHVTQLVVENELEIHQGTIIHWRWIQLQISWCISDATNLLMNYFQLNINTSTNWHTGFINNTSHGLSFQVNIPWLINTGKINHGQVDLPGRRSGAPCRFLLPLIFCQLMLRPQVDSSAPKGAAGWAPFVPFPGLLAGSPYHITSIIFHDISRHCWPVSTIDSPYIIKMLSNHYLH